MIWTATNDMFGTFLHDYNLILIFAIITFAFSLFLRSATVFLVQIAVFVGMIVIDQTTLTLLYIPISIIQIFISFYLVYRIKKAIDRNYMLVMEKTHQAEPNITRNRDSGSRPSFLYN
ncbi:hypothetical protein ACLIBG_01290 [Virgibacillus sp. W0181]|uniref:hypothetical protein n=1 Tax=Virgibacillus sp. W0181 TaxID=3391581 RepID=UPI003F47185A